MNTTPETEALKGACALFMQDLLALPEEAITKKFSPATRTVADIVYEVNLVNDHVGMIMRGEEPFDWPDGDYVRAPEGFDTKQVVIDAFAESSARIVATAESFSAEKLREPLETDQGTKTRGERCGFMTVHLWYHSGQLNFIQTLLGDAAWHWK
ncbi:DinB family protein [bacterium]|nr:MAG: DinB family protein [bacterium]